MTRVREIMHPRVARILPDADLSDLIRMLARESVSGVPVVERDSKLVGVVSVSDVMAGIAELLYSHPHDSLETALRSRRVGDIMTPLVFAVAPDTPVSDLAASLHQEGMHRAFVVDHGRLCGVVSAFDVLRAAARST